MIEKEDGSYKVALGKRAVYVRALGLASMMNCMCVCDFIDEMLASGRTFIIIDLAECTGMDSTFMGVLAGAANYTKHNKPVGVAVVNASDALVKLLKSVGITELVFVDPDPFETPDINFMELKAHHNEEDRLACIHAAHQHLIKASEENAKIFSNFLNALELEMKKRGLL